MIPDIRRLQHPVAIADEANFSRAAYRLGITRPALGRSIAQTGEACGPRLFDCGRVGVALTFAATQPVAGARRPTGG